MKRVENNETNGENADHEEYLRLPQCYQIVIWCRCVRMRLQVGKAFTDSRKPVCGGKGTS